MNDKLKICTECQHFIKEKKICNLCGCYMPVKTLIPLMKCPDGKW
jgi:RNA polymerase subunit RPABC4/transcription elongation factor Spt4